MITGTAEFESQCMVCEGTIHEGESIALLEEEDEWVHLTCAEEEMLS